MRAWKILRHFSGYSIAIYIGIVIVCILHWNKLELNEITFDKINHTQKELLLKYLKIYLNTNLKIILFELSK